MRWVSKFRYIAFRWSLLCTLLTRLSEIRKRTSGFGVFSSVSKLQRVTKPSKSSERSWKRKEKIRNLKFSMKNKTYRVFDEEIIKSTNACVFVVRSLAKNEIQQLEDFIFVGRGEFWISREYFEQFDERVILVECTFLNQLLEIRCMLGWNLFSLDSLANFSQRLQNFFVVVRHNFQYFTVVSLMESRKSKRRWWSDGFVFFTDEFYKLIDVRWLNNTDYCKFIFKRGLF